MSKEKEDKYKKLLLSLLFDGIGMLSFAIPFVGEFSDIVWAPLAGWLMTRMYKGKIGQGAGIVTFLEEIIPGLDVVPTFTIMWLYTYVFRKSKKAETLGISS
ncbi:hypothetical protein ZORO111903_14485 [Zobellia roscoffensis]|uniref:hypothetical protein n=1 Tax=Zobellia roscoffensis TaxID=2779508 RepID=UPI00188C2F0B|nr:hypothetical protein [Zobellia roscoffensis]